MTAKKFGQLLRVHRKRVGLTQNGLAEALGVDFTYISKIEGGRAAPPSTGRIAVAAAVLHLTAEERDELFAAAAKLPAEVEEWAASTPDAIKLYRHLRAYPKTEQASLIQDLIRKVRRGQSRPSGKDSVTEGDDE